MGDDKEGTLPPSSEVKRTSPPFRPDPDLIKFLEGGRPGQRKVRWPWKARKRPAHHL